MPLIGQCRHPDFQGATNKSRTCQDCNLFESWITICWWILLFVMEFRIHIIFWEFEPILLPFFFEIDAVGGHHILHITGSNCHKSILWNAPGAICKREIYKGTRDNAEDFPGIVFFGCNGMHMGMSAEHHVNPWTAALSGVFFSFVESMLVHIENTTNFAM